VIRKTREDDINLKAGKKTQICNARNSLKVLIPINISTDIRISASTEEVLPLEIPASKVTSERIKERTSFKFGWMQIDFTKIS
jgi:hypothetical protein